MFLLTMNYCAPGQMFIDVVLGFARVPNPIIVDLPKMDADNMSSEDLRQLATLLKKLITSPTPPVVSDRSKSSAEPGDTSKENFGR